MKQNYTNLDKNETYLLAYILFMIFIRLSYTKSQYLFYMIS
jgi:hypothetical protein